MISNIKITLFTLLGLFISLSANAAVPAWEIIPEKSSITFTATQNGSPVSFEFKKFSGNINFDPAQLTTSHITILVDLNSVTTSYKDIIDTLKTPDWFDVKLFPQATFKANKFTKINDKNFTADGTLTLRDKTLPVTLAFILDEYTSSQAHAKGNVTLKRTQFGVGKGEWASTNSIKDNVNVSFIITATKK